MITRRSIVQGVAGMAIPLIGSLASPARSSKRDASAAAASTDVDFVAYGFPYDWHPVPALGNWPLDHTSVVTSTGTQWGCFGRTYAADPRNATVVARGRGDELWAKAIAGADGSAGIENGVTGVCDQCANRILLPAGIDVRNSPGNEIAILFCGVYGFGMSALVRRIRDAAAAVNKDHPGRISDAQVAAAVTKVTGGMTEEWRIVRSNNDRILKPALGARYDEVQADLENVYLGFYYRRIALYHAFKKGNFDKRALVFKLRDAFSQSLSDLKDVMGEQSYARIVPVPPAHVPDYLDRKTNDEAR